MRTPTKRWKLEKLLIAVQELIQKERYDYITAETYALELKAKKHMITQCFAVLNREGLLGQGENSIPWDTKMGGCREWQPTIFYIIKEEENED